MKRKYYIANSALGIAQYIYSFLPDLKDVVVVESRRLPGLDVVGTGDMTISPVTMFAAWEAFQNSKAVQDFIPPVSRDASAQCRQSCGQKASCRNVNANHLK